MVISGAVLLAVVEPARREHAAACERVRQVRAWAEEHTRYLDELRRAREALDRNDPCAWEAVGRNQGLGRTDEIRLLESGRSPR